MAERKAKLDAKKAASKAWLSGIAAEYAEEPEIDDDDLLRLAFAHGDATALEDLTGASPRSLTYDDLQRAALRLGALIREQADGGAVVVCIEEGAALVLSMCAALASGCTFLLLEPSLPTARAAHMITEVGVRLALHAAGGAAHEAASALPALAVDVDALVAADGPVPPLPEPPPPPASLAYVCYTSGSTGLPKGVMVDRRALLSYARANAAAHEIGRGARVLLAAGVAFDPSIGEAWTALVAGATLLLPRRAEAKEQLGPLLARSGATHVCSTPALWATVELSAAELPALRCVCLGGEAMAPALIRRWAAALPLHNIYGVTECTVYQASRRVRAVAEPEPPPTAEAEAAAERAAAREAGLLGAPLPGCTLTLLDDSLRPVAADGGGEGRSPSAGRSSRLGTSVSRSSPPSALSTSTASGSTSPAISRSGTAASSASSAAPTARCSCAG